MDFPKRTSHQNNTIPTQGHIKACFIGLSVGTITMGEKLVFRKEGLHSLLNIDMKKDKGKRRSL